MQTLKKFKSDVSSWRLSEPPLVVRDDVHGVAIILLLSPRVSPFCPNFLVDPWSVFLNINTSKNYALMIDGF